MSQPSPDSIIFVLAYLFILSLGAFYGGATILGTTYPAAQQMGMGEMLMLITGIAPLILGVLFVLSGWLLWGLQPAGRALTIMLAVLMVVISGGSIPMLLIEELSGVALYVPLMTTVLLLTSSLVVIATLMQPPVRHVSNAKSKTDAE